MWVLENLLQGLAWLCAEGLTFINNTIVDMFSFVVVVNQTTYITELCTYMMGISLALVTLISLKHGVGTYVFETEGDPEQDPVEMITRISQVLAVIGSNSWIFDTLFGLSEAFSRDIGVVNSQNVAIELKKLLEDSSYGVLDVGKDTAKVVFVLLIVVAIGLLVFYFALGIRGAELTLMKILCPIFALDLLNSSRERWNAFITDYIVNFLSIGIQLLCFRQLCLSIATIRNDGFGAYAAVAIGWLYLSIRAPKWLEKYTYSSGIKQTASSGARGAMGMAYAIRMFR